MSGRQSVEDKKRKRREMSETASSSEEMDDIVQVCEEKRAKHQEVDATAFHKLSSFAAEEQIKLPDASKEDIKEPLEEMDAQYQKYQSDLLMAKIQTQFPEAAAEEIKEAIDLVDTLFPALSRAPTVTTASSVKTLTDVEMQVKSASRIPERSLAISEILQQAYLPTLGLPVKWDKTQAEHQATIFKPENMEASPWDQTKGMEIKEKIKKHFHSPVGFIMSTPGNPMPGTPAPAAVRFEHYHRPKLHQQIVNGAKREALIPCIAQGDYVYVEALQADHGQAKTEIVRRQQELIAILNNKENAGVVEFMMQRPGMKKFFIKARDEKYYGTLFFYELYFKDIDNIWLICQACNLHENNTDTVTWLKTQWLYGSEFLDYLAREAVKAEAGSEQAKVMLDKIKTKGQNKELAEVIINWFWDNHANYFSIQEKLLEEKSESIQILRQKTDHVIGKSRVKRAERVAASLAFQLRRMAASLEPKTDRQRVESESIPEGLIYQAIPGDGHCLFHAVGLYVGEDQKFLRRVVALHLKGRLEEFREFIHLPTGQTIEDHINGMRNGTEWADNVEIELLMRILNRPIVVITPGGNIRNSNDLVRFNGEPIFVYYNDHNHYDALLLKTGYTAQAIFKQLMHPVEQAPQPVFFKKLDKNKKMEIIREGEAKIKDTLERLLKQKKEQLLSEGHTEKRTDEIIEEIREVVSRKAAILYKQKLKEAEKKFRQSK